MSEQNLVTTSTNKALSVNSCFRKSPTVIGEVVLSHRLVLDAGIFEGGFNRLRVEAGFIYGTVFLNFFVKKDANKKEPTGLGGKLIVSIFGSKSHKEELRHDSEIYVKEWSCEFNQYGHWQTTLVSFDGSSLPTPQFMGPLKAYLANQGYVVSNKLLMSVFGAPIDATVRLWKEIAEF